MDRIRIAIAFDYDDTLGPDSTTGYLADMVVDTHDFWANRVNPLVAAGWDQTLAYMWEMVRESNSRPPESQFTRTSMETYGRHHALHPGVVRSFASLKRYAATRTPAADLEFFIISSGLAPIVEASPVRKHVADAWACDFEYDSNGAIVFPKRVVSFTDKTRYLFQIEKGLIGQTYRGSPLAVNQRMDPGSYHVPMSRMIYVGDGMTDIPCFSLLEKNHGYGIAVYNPHDDKKWREAWGYVADGRVNGLLPADLSPKSALYTNLQILINGIVAQWAAASTSPLS